MLKWLRGYARNGTPIKQNKTNEKSCYFQIYSLFLWKKKKFLTGLNFFYLKYMRRYFESFSKYI